MKKIHRIVFLIIALISVGLMAWTIVVGMSAPDSDKIADIMGMSYQYDENGNEKQDALGNPIPVVSVENGVESMGTATINQMRKSDATIYGTTLEKVKNIESKIAECEQKLADNEQKALKEAEAKVAELNAIRRRTPAQNNELANAQKVVDEYKKLPETLNELKAKATWDVNASDDDKVIALAEAEFNGILEQVKKANEALEAKKADFDAAKQLVDEMCKVANIKVAQVDGREDYAATLDELLGAKAINAAQKRQLNGIKATIAEYQKLANERKTALDNETAYESNLPMLKEAIAQAQLDQQSIMKLGKVVFYNLVWLEILMGFAILLVFVGFVLNFAQNSGGIGKTIAAAAIVVAVVGVAYFIPHHNHVIAGIFGVETGGVDGAGGFCQKSHIVALAVHEIRSRRKVQQDLPAIEILDRSEFGIHLVFSLLCGDFCPGILEGDRAVEHRFAAGNVIFFICTEVADPFKLTLEAGFDGAEGGFQFGSDDLQGFRVQEFLVVLVFRNRIGIGNGEQTVVQACFGVYCVGCGDPVNGAFDLASIGSVAALRFGIVGAMDHADFAVFVLFHTGTGHKVGAAEAHFLARSQTVELLDGFFHEVVPFNVELAGEGHFAASGFRIFRVVDDFHLFDLTGGIVVNDQSDRVHDRHSALGCLVEVFPDTVFQECNVRQTVEFGDPDLFAEIPECFRGNAAAAEGADRRHTGIIPAVDVVCFHQFPEFAFAHNRVGESKTGEFDLAGLGRGIQIFDEPIVQGTVDLKFQGADGVGDPFNGVFQRMRKVVERVHAPGIAGVVMFGMTDPVDRRVTHMHIGMSHIDLCTQDLAAVGELTVFHPGEEIQVFFYGAVPVGAGLAGGSQVALVFFELIVREFANVCLTLFDQIHSVIIHLPEIVGCVVETVFPVCPQPLHVIENGLDKFRVFLCGVGVVHTQVEFAAVLDCSQVVHIDRFCVTDMEITVRFRRETGNDFAAVFSCCQIFFNDRVNKIHGCFCGCFTHVVLSGVCPLRDFCLIFVCMF